MSLKNKPIGFPTGEQKDILESNGRITVVTAAPGSGKTAVFIEFLNQNLPKFPTRQRGIAAISFTHAASGEISQRLGITLGNQHFIGTLDSFLLRFVVKPFAPAVGLCPDGIDLLPSPLDENLTTHAVSYGPRPENKLSAFALKFASGTLEKPIFNGKDNFKSIIVNGTFADGILKKKKEIWRERGLITHSDCHFLAAYILSEPRIGPTVRKLISLRFPLVLVDEFQDTGCFLSLALAQILMEPGIRGLVVGDPDQSIYEFSGAKPELFKAIQGLTGAYTKPITTTQRCSPGICNIARQLSDTGTNLTAKVGLEEGKHILFVHNYDGPVRIENKLLDTLKALNAPPSETAFLCRTNKLVRQLRGDHSDIYFQGTSNIGKAFAKASMKFLQGNAKEAFNIVSSKMGLLIFEDESMRRKDFEKNKIHFLSWKKGIFHLLKEISSDVQNETWNMWLERSKVEAEKFAKDLGYERKFGSNFRKDNSKGNAVKDLIAPPVPIADDFLKAAKFKTIHEAKGSEFDSVVIFFPKPHARHNPCISGTWFATTGPTEEKRIGYVAITRARKNMILCVHQNTYAALQKSRNEFLKNFTISLA